MSLYPITHLFPNNISTTAISGPTIQVLDTSTGDVRHTATIDPAGPIRCSAVDQGNRYLATAGDDKILRVWEIEGLKLVNERELPKRPTSITFTADAQTILVSDKFGDVFRRVAFSSPCIRSHIEILKTHSYNFTFTPLTEKQKKDALSSHENPSGGTLILGHASLLNAFLLSPDERYIITADRDEHIRVSWYPQGYNIEMYCLGHTKYVSAIHNPSFALSELISGGGDQALKIWDWMLGTAKHEILVWDAVEPYIRVRNTKRKRGEDGEEGEARRKGRGKKAKGKGKAKTDDAEEVPETETPPAEDVTAAATSSADVGAGAESVVEEKGDKVLVIHKIATVASRRIVFSAIGATALFSVDYPGNGCASDVRVFDFGVPILDFVVLSEDNLVWVTLDGNWTESTEPASKSFVRLVEVSESGKLVESTLKSTIVEALNSRALLPASPEDLKKLELYNELVAMPKGNDGAENDQDGDAAPTELEKQNKKILGRLKNKQKVLEKEQALASAVDDGVREPQAKKNKSDLGEEKGEDVDMIDA